MKWYISELLNDVSADHVQITEKTPLSAKAIRQRTLGRVEENKPKTVRWLPRVAVVAAALLMLMISACAADQALNEGQLFGGFLGNDLSDKQKEVLNTIGKDYNQYRDYWYNDELKKDVLTNNGSTLTPIFAVTDGRICYIHVRLEAPEGMVLEDLAEDRSYSFNGLEGWSEQMKVKFAYGSHNVSNAKVHTLPDEDPSDRVKEFVIEIYAYWESGFNGNKVRLSIPGLWIRNKTGSGSKYSYTKLFSAGFEFDITIDRNDERIDLKNLGVSHYIEQYDFSVNLEQVIITPLRMEVHYTATLPENKNILPDGGYAQLVMKDGTKLTFGDHSDVSDGPDVGYQVLSKKAADLGVDAEKFVESVAREYNLDTYDKYTFEEPVVLEDIDYIVWCGGQIVDVN